MPKALVNPNLDPHHHLTRKAITQRFMRAVDIVKANRRKGVKNDTGIANAIGMMPQNLSKYAKGTQDVTIEQAARFCEYFDINDSYILRGKGNIEEMMTTNQRIDKLEERVLELEKHVFSS